MRQTPLSARTSAPAWERGEENEEKEDMDKEGSKWEEGMKEEDGRERYKR